MSCFQSGSSAMERRIGSRQLVAKGLRFKLAEISADCVFLDALATAVSAPCPCCGTSSRRIQSRHLRQAADLPIAGRWVIRRLTVRRYLCAAAFADRLMMPVRNDALLRVVGRRNEKPGDKPAIIGIDDVAFRRGQRCGTMSTRPLALDRKHQSSLSRRCSHTHVADPKDGWQRYHRSEASDPCRTAPG